MNPVLTTTALAVVLASTGVLPVYAQEESSKLVLEEVIVTARKREENLQDVAVAVTAVSDRALLDAQIRDSVELTKLVPSLTFASGSGNSFAIRGIGTQAFSSGAEASVSTMLDGVVLARSAQSFMQLVDIQRVEVLRGPQGTLFGKNSSAGVVHFITKDPSDSFEADISATAIEEDEYRMSGTISAPITDTLGFRLTYGGVRDDGYIENVYDGNTYGGKDSDNGRIKFRWQPTDSLDLKWTSDVSREDDGSKPRPWRIVNDPATAAVLLPVVASKENYDVNLDSSLDKSIDTFGHSMEINWDIGEYTLTSISAYRNFESSDTGDVDGRPDDPVGIKQFSDIDLDQYSQELRIISPADRFFSYVAGVYAFYSENDKVFTREVVGTTSTADFTVETTNLAAFGELTFNLSDQLSAIVGGRYTYDKLDYTFSRVGPIPGPVAPFSDNGDDTDLSGKAALEWAFADSAMTYVSVTQGYKGQAYNVNFGVTPPLDAVEPETSITYEIGLKSTLLERRLMLNAALFRTDYDDFQGQTGVLAGNQTVFILTNAGEVRSQGLELDFTALVTHNLMVFGGFALIDATIEDFENGPCSFGMQYRAAQTNPVGECAPPSVGGQGSQDLSGGDLPFSPDWKVNLNANYTIALGSLPFEMVTKVAYQGQGDQVMDISQDEYTEHDAYHVFDVALTVQDLDGSWDVTGFVKNAADNRYANSIVSQPQQFSPDGYAHGVPKYSQRTYGIEARYHWF